MADCLARYLVTELRRRRQSGRPGSRMSGKGRGRDRGGRAKSEWVDCRRLVGGDGRCKRSDERGECGIGGSEFACGVINEFCELPRGQYRHCFSLSFASSSSFANDGDGPIISAARLHERLYGQFEASPCTRAGLQHTSADTIRLANGMRRRTASIASTLRISDC